MKLNKIITVFAVLIHLPALADIDEDRLTALHKECEEAYMVNDFTRMKATIEERETLLHEDNRPAFNPYAYNSHLALLYKDLGSLHYCLADIDGTSGNEATACYQKSLEIYLNTLKDSHGAAVLRTELAQLHYRYGEYSEALGYLAANRNHYMQSGQERMELETWSQIALCKARLGRFEEALADIDSTIWLAGRFDVPIERLRKKGKILALQSEALDTSAAEAETYFQQYFDFQRDSIIKKFNGMDAAERESYWLRMQPFITDCFRLEEEAPGLLYDVILFSKSILLQFSQINPSAVAPHWTDIQKRLPKDACAIEYVQYEKHGQAYLGAIVLHPTGEPEFYRLLKLSDLLKFQLPSGCSVEKAMSAEVPEFKDALYSCNDLCRIIWTKELRNAIRDAETVFFAADGILHKLAIEYMFPQHKAPAFRRLTSTRELLRSEGHEAEGDMLICGGIDHYNCSAKPDSSMNDRLAYELLARKRIRFRNLKGAGEEVRMVKDIRNNPADTLLTNDRADEQTLVALMNEYSIVTIATHGYFSGTSQRWGTDLKTWKSDEKLSQSVIIVSGAQTNMNDTAFNPDLKDGIISARELARTDLSNVRLFILSACQSGLGEITGDGVFGLQRGLKNAGVRAMIVSLWEVDDKATSYFMVRFHKALSEGKGTSEAFDVARDAMDEKITTYDEGIDMGTLTEGEPQVTVRQIYNKPRYKNAFILIDSL